MVSYWQLHDFESEVWMWPYLLESLLVSEFNLNTSLLVSEFKLQYPTRLHFIEVRAQIRGYHCATQTSK